MKPKNSDEFVDSLVVRDLTGANAEFTESDLEFARRNPDVVAKLADPLEVKKRYILIIFLAAIGLATASKIIEYTGVATDNHVVNDLLTNVAFSVAIELFGAACIAFVMELIFERRLKRNQVLVRALLEEADLGRDRGRGRSVGADPDPDPRGNEQPGLTTSG
ncbi:hypothetical protein JD292_11765 [Leucobacter sp. CSA2]|uniref:Uncharacterized protein n=1 Tax=Leucobacter edaphi TaxID=2796472 RepID=A0A934UXG9_9MICO|nr:hypothetical protein [Leucobacter edaphi]MBK0422749.1 hypothetical protein [Leucobacter edaphi]